MARLGTGDSLSKFYYPAIFVVGALITPLILGLAAKVYALPAFLNDAAACSRTSQEQPESFGWNFRMSTPSCSCPDNSPPSVLPVVVTAKDDTSGRRADVLLLDTPCSFSN
jgi:hypothetical protein